MHAIVHASYQAQTLSVEPRSAQAFPLSLTGAPDAAMATLCGEPLTFVKGEQQDFSLGVNL